MIVTLQSRNTITVPLEVRRELHLEPGDPLEANVEGGRLVLTPVAVVPRSLRLSEDGAARESAAEEDVREGRVEVFETAGAILADLDDRDRR